MNLGIGLWLLLAPLLDAAHTAPTIPAGPWPAGVLLTAAARAAERPVFPESPTVANTTVVIERELVVSRSALPAILSILHDAGIAFVELTPGEPRHGWFATRNTAGARRPIRMRVEVISLRHADAEEVVEILNERVEEREKELLPGDYRTKFIADPRTQSVVVRYTSAKRLAEYQTLLAALDEAPAPGSGGPVLRTFRPDHVPARSLKTELEARWGDRGGFPIRVVAPETQNVLLVRCPIQVWDEVEAILRELDRP